MHVNYLKHTAFAWNNFEYKNKSMKAKNRSAVNENIICFCFEIKTANFYGNQYIYKQNSTIPVALRLPYTQSKSACKWTLEIAQKLQNSRRSSGIICILEFLCSLWSSRTISSVRLHVDLLWVQGMLLVA